jgi:hypothetical protein
MAFDNAGNLYVANNISSSIQFYANTGTGLSSTVATFVTGVASVRAIAFDDDGNLYVGGGGAGTGYIYRYDNTPDGLATTATTILAGHAYSITGLDVIGGVIPEPAAWVILAGTALFIATLVSRRRRRPAGQQ